MRDHALGLLDQGLGQTRMNDWNCWCLSMVAVLQFIMELTFILLKKKNKKPYEKNYNIFIDIFECTSFEKQLKHYMTLILSTI